MRKDGRVRSRACMIANGVNEEEYRDILCKILGDSESEASWQNIFD
ncbi:MAG: transposase [Acidibacillus sp.]|nr:transposase [Acidibacillus sp.]